MITLRKVFENHRHASGSEKETPNHFSNCQPQIFVVRLASVSIFFLVTWLRQMALSHLQRPGYIQYLRFPSPTISLKIPNTAQIWMQQAPIQKAANFHLRQQCPPSQMLLFQARNHERLSDGRAGCLFCSWTFHKSRTYISSSHVLQHVFLMPSHEWKPLGRRDIPRCLQNCCELLPFLQQTPDLPHILHSQLLDPSPLALAVQPQGVKLAPLSLTPDHLGLALSPGPGFQEWTLPFSSSRWLFFSFWWCRESRGQRECSHSLGLPVPHRWGLLSQDPCRRHWVENMHICIIPILRKRIHDALTKKVVYLAVARNCISSFSSQLISPRYMKESNICRWFSETSCKGENEIKRINFWPHWPWDRHRSPEGW